MGDGEGIIFVIFGIFALLVALAIAVNLGILPNGIS
jgi:hypothetical protein